MTTQAYQAANTTAIPASTVSSQPAKKAPIAPWIGEGGFVPLPREFYLFAVPQISKGAAQQFEYHCASAMTSGEHAGFSYCYRETMATKRKKSLSSVDRANAELEKRGMIRDTGRRYKHGGAVIFQIMPPSKWTFDECKNAPSTAQKFVVKDAKMRPITRDKETVKTKKQQTAPREILPVEAVAPVNVVVDFQSSVSGPEAVAPSLETNRLRLELEQVGFESKTAAWLVEAHGESECAHQLRRLQSAKGVKCAVRWLRTAIKQAHRDERPVTALPTTSQAPTKPSADEVARQRIKELARVREETRAAQAVFERLDAARQNFIRVDVELRRKAGKTASLFDSLQSQENAALMREMWRERPQ